MAPHSGTLAWKIPWTEEHGRLQSMGSLRVRHNWETSLSLFTFMHWRRKWQPTPVLLPGESQGWGSLVGCRLWGRTESDMTEVTWQPGFEKKKPLLRSLYKIKCIPESCELFLMFLSWTEIIYLAATGSYRPSRLSCFISAKIKSNQYNNTSYIILIRIWLAVKRNFIK